MPLKHCLRIWEELEMLETKCKSAESLFNLVIVVPPTLAPVLSPVPLLSNVFFANSAAQPFHHTPHEGQHFPSSSRQQANWIVEPQEAPLLVEEDKELENTSAGIARKQEGRTSFQCRCDCICIGRKDRT